MAKQKKQCKDCSLCEVKNGLGWCRMGGGLPSVTFADNAACKMRVIPSDETIARK